MKNEGHARESIILGGGFGWPIVTLGWVWVDLSTSTGLSASPVGPRGLRAALAAAASAASGYWPL